MDGGSFYKTIILMKQISILLIFLLASTIVQGQSNKRLKEFSKDHSTFIDELNTFILSASPSEFVKKQMKTLSKKWKDDQFSTFQKETIIDFSNRMLKSRKRGTHFEALINAILSFHESPTFDSQFRNWSTVVFFFLEHQPTSRQMKFLRYTDDLFKENVLFKNRSLSWYTSNMSFSFELIDSMPCMTFKQPLDLMCIARGDTMKIYQTIGSYYPMTSEWKGQDGLVDWKKAGYSISEVYAELADYNIRFKTPNYTADSVKFYNFSLFGNDPIHGKLEDKLINRNKTDIKVNYPKFDSYQKNYILSDLIEDVDLQGGYSLHGNRFSSNGGDGHLANLIFYRNDKPFIRLSTERITISSQRVIGSNVAVKILFENDSITHSGINMIYNLEDRRLDLLSDDDGISSSPYVNTYHNLEMQFQKLEWKIDDNVMTFGTIFGNNSQPAFFKSTYYFTEKRFDRMLGIDSKHPLLVIRDFNQKYGIKNTFLIQDFLKISPYSDDQDIRFLMNLARQGFLDYNSNLGYAVVKDNVERYIMSKSEKIDYDVISFYSSKPTDNKNAILDLNTMALDIYDIKNIQVSEVRDVIAIPNDQKITVKKGLNFSMQGKILAGSGGRFRIYSDDIDFNYEGFRLYFSEATTEIWIPNKSNVRDAKGQLALEPLFNQVTITNGELLIDTSINKSGIWKDDYSQYPIIRSYERSKVYYDQDDIYAGVYDRSRFYFDLDPFEIDSLDSYERKSIELNGELNSSNIFPNFRQPLKVQDDNSLGFEINIPQEGYPLYVDKGKFLGTNELRLNKSGLTGSGIFEYLSSTTSSNNYVFFPDSMNTSADSFVLNKVDGELGVPDVNGTDIYEHWLPYEDVLTVKKKTQDFSMYDTQANLDGEIYLRPYGLTGAGKVDLEDATLSSQLYDFNPHTFNADTADFSLRTSDDLQAIAFESVNLRTEIDFLQRYGTFNSNGANSYVSLPENQYLCYIDELKWYMDETFIELGASDGGLGSRFVSIHPDQDSLSFYSKKATYSLQDYIIKAEEVDEIPVADAVIYPFNQSVRVERNAIMNRLYNSTLAIKNEQFTHDLFDADISIFGKNNYSGFASTKFLGRGLEEQTLVFDTLYVDPSNQSIGIGQITPEQAFKFNPQFSYKGNVTMQGGNKEFLYDGAFQVLHECYLIDNAWVKFNDYVGMEEIKLPIGDNLVDESGNQLYVGPVMSDDKMYPTFLSTLESVTDVVMMPIKGNLSYQSSQSKFIVESETDSLSSRFTMSNSGCVMKGEGNFNLGLNVGRVETSTTGKFTYKPVDQTFQTKCMLSFDFFMSQKSMEFMGDDLFNDPMADELELSENYYFTNFNRILRDENLTLEYDMYGMFEKLPKALNKSLYFYEVNLEWDAENSALISKKMLGLGNVNNYQINKLYTGRIELNNDNAGDFFNIYLETDIGEWYYFNFSNDVLLTRSSLEEYNLEIVEIKVSKRELPTSKGQVPFKYDLSTEDDVDNFKKRFFR